MKIVLYLLVIAAAAGAGWVAQPGIYDMLKDRKESRVAARAQRDEAAKKEGRDEASGNHNSKMLDALINRTPNPSSPTPPGPGTATSTKTTAGTAPVTTRPATTAPVDDIEARYPMPNFRTIEEITKEWSAIPSRAFPRKVKTKVPLQFDSDKGKVELPVDSEAKALAMVGGLLLVAREGQEAYRIQVPLANTDLKETMTALYEKYKEYRRGLVVKERLAARDRKARANGASEVQMAKAGPRPEVGPGGTISIMMDDIRSGKYVELKESAITSWGNLQYEEIVGEHYWTSTIQLTVENPIFGPSPTEVMALIKDNKVVKWIYTGSREPVQ